MAWFEKHWAGLCGILLSALYIYLQLVVWKKHGDDLMLTAANIIVTCSLWIVLLIAIGKYWRTHTTTTSVSEKQIMRAGVLISKAGEAEWLARELERVWHVWNNEHEPLIRPLGQLMLPDVIQKNHDKQLLSFRTQYHGHIGGVRANEPDFHSTIMDGPAPYRNIEYVDLREALKKHADLLRQLAQSLLNPALNETRS